MFDVIVCGSLHLDIVVNAPALPRIDETAVGRSWQQICGGKGGNQAVQAARSGAQTAMIGRIGNDAFGQSLHDNLNKAGVDTRCVTSDQQNGSGMSVAILQDNGDYGAVIVSGANLTLDADGIAEHWRQLGGAKVLILQNEIPYGVNVAVAKVAADDGAIVVYNAAPARDMKMTLMDHVDVLIVNRVEAEEMAGVPVHDTASASLAMPKLLGSSRSVVITLGGKGLVVCSSDGLITEIAAVPVDVTSTHGAGDCFVGVLAQHLAQNFSVVESCRAANRCAAEFVARG